MKTRSPGVPTRRLEDEVEGRSFADGAFRPSPAAVAVDDAAHGRQPDANAGKFALAVKPLERAEQLVGVDHVEANAVVPDEQAGGAPPRPPLPPQPRGRPPFRRH